MMNHSDFVCVFGVIVFFFKQKTADEMRISDWSSDVCSSDLRSLKQPNSRRCRKQLAWAGPTSPPAAMPMLPTANTKVSLHSWDSRRRLPSQIGRASCRERVCQYVSISVVAGSLKKKIVHSNVHHNCTKTPLYKEKSHA